MLQDGAWQLVANLQLATHRATHKVTPGDTYRVTVPATATHDAGTSASVIVPERVSVARSSAATATASVSGTASRRTAGGRSKPGTSGSASPSPTPGASPAEFA